MTLLHSLYMEVDEICLETVEYKNTKNSENVKYASVLLRSVKNPNFARQFL